MTNTPPPKHSRKARVKLANALDDHDRVRHNSVDASKLHAADSALGEAVEEAIDEEAVTEYLDETQDD